MDIYEFIATFKETWERMTVDELFKTREKLLVQLQDNRQRIVLNDNSPHHDAGIANYLINERDTLHAAECQVAQILKDKMYVDPAVLAAGNMLVVYGISNWTYNEASTLLMNDSKRQLFFDTWNCSSPRFSVPDHEIFESWRRLRNQFSSS